MSLILVDPSAASFTLPDNFTIKGMSFKKRQRVVNIAYKDGGRQVGDAMIDTRLVEIEGILYGVDEATYLTNKNLLFKWITKTDLKLYFIAGRYINVKQISNVAHNFAEGGFDRFARIKLTCLCEDPFFYYDAGSTDIQNPVASPTFFTINNAGDFIVFPVITITNAAANVSFTLKNTTDDNRYFTFADVLSAPGDVIVIDCAAGTVQKNGINRIDLLEGDFLRLLSGNNDFEYTGAACQINTAWTVREL